MHHIRLISHISLILTKVGKKKDENKFSDSMPRHFPEEMAEAKNQDYHNECCQFVNLLIRTEQ